MFFFSSIPILIKCGTSSRCVSMCWHARRILTCNQYLNYSITTSDPIK
jgi:hypothetical protein